MEAVQSQQHEHFLHLLHLSDSGAKTYLGQFRLPDASSEGIDALSEECGEELRGRDARSSTSTHRNRSPPAGSSKVRVSAKSRRRSRSACALPEPGPVPQTSKVKKTKKGSAQVKAMIAQSHWTLECQRNSSGSPLQAPCESFLQGQENIQQLQHFRGVIPELFSSHRPQAEEDFQKTSRLSLPASLQRSSDSLAQAIEFLWEEGEGQSLAADVLSAIQHYQPSMRRCLNGSWRFFKTWQRFEIPARAPPMT